MSSEQDDLINLPSLTVDAIRDKLRDDYENNTYSKYVGSVLIAINPNKELPIYDHEHLERYCECHDRHDLPPHCFWVARKCYRDMYESQQNQTIVVSGESGAGKTETSKHLVRMFARLADGIHALLPQHLIQVNPIIELFGNATTPLNLNSSRFSRLIEIRFLPNGNLMGAKNYAYMLEKWRVVKNSSPSDRNFHIFYALLAGLDESTLAKLRLSTQTHWRVLASTEDGTTFASESDYNTYRKIFFGVTDTMAEIGMKHEEIEFMMMAIAATLHLTAIEFSEQHDDFQDKAVILDDAPLHNVAHVLQLDRDVLKKVLLTNQFGLSDVEDSASFKNEKQARDSRDGLAKALYDRLFSWLISRINAYLSPRGPVIGPDGRPIDRRSRITTIGLLDMSGFEDLSISRGTRNSLEQLFINAANERVHAIYTRQEFHSECEELAKLGYDIAELQWEGNNDLVLQLLFDGSIPGLLSLLDDQSRQGGATNTGLRRHLEQHLKDNPCFNSRQRTDHRFVVQHYAAPVEYDVTGFLEKNRDTLSNNLKMVMLTSEFPAIRMLFEAGTDGTGTVADPRFSFIADPNFSLSNSIGANCRMNRKRNTVAESFRISLDLLISKTEGTHVSFIRCIKPNGQMEKDKFDDETVERQLRYCGIETLARLRRLGPPIRFTHSEFFARYQILAGSIALSGPGRETSEQIVSDCHVDAQVGDEKVLMEESAGDMLEKQLSDEKERRSRLRKMQLEEERRAQEIRLEMGTDPAGEQRVHPDGKENSPRSSSENPNPDSSEKMDCGRTDITTNLLRNRVWNLFRYVPPDRVSGSEMVKTPLVVIKVLLYILLFALILFAIVASQVSFVAMTSIIFRLEENAREKLIENRGVGDAVKKVPVRYFFTYVTLMQICLAVPHALTFFVYLWKAVFGGQKVPSLYALAPILLLETLKTTSLCYIVHFLLPRIDSVRALLLMNAVGVVPAFLKIFFGFSRVDRDHQKRDAQKSMCRVVIWFILNVTAFLVQFSTVVLCSIENFQFSHQDLFAWQTQFSDLKDRPANLDINWFIGSRTLLGQKFNRTSSFLDAVRGPKAIKFDPIFFFSFILFSLTWWENFVDQDLIHYKNITILPLHKFKDTLARYRQKATVVTSAWCIGIIVAFPYIFYIKHKFHLTITNEYPKRQYGSDLRLFLYWPIFNGVAGIVGYTLSVCVLKMAMQRISFSVPLFLATPVSIAIVLSKCYVPNLKYDGHFVCPEDDSFAAIIWQLPFLLLLWLSLLITTAHIWHPRQVTLDHTEKLLVLPGYNPVFLAQDLMLNRRRHEENVLIGSNGAETNEAYRNGGPAVDASTENVDNAAQETTVIMCATLWHETKEEMTQILKSIFRMDKRFAERDVQRRLFRTNNHNFYSIKTNIYFDDAILLDKDTGESHVNRYVTDFMECLDEAASSIHAQDIHVSDPTKVLTPYGANLVWTLMGGTVLTVHLKDKNKIRHKKRWSQCMYMYQLMGHELLEQFATEDATINANTYARKNIFKYLPRALQRKAENTYILALDGDVDFKPDAVELLIDNLRRDLKVGAACGRIHPIGRGPVVWFQVFEYAIAHWLQKAAEHVMGCVLCSPGCFSLFRCSSLMDDNVMRRYVYVAEEARHFVQYDQGEDRWLCTLLLQAGHRVEYNAAADANTFCPSSFREFFSQRRRWGPSTMVNIVDLLSDFQTTVRKNDNLSYLYMMYQFLMFVSSILGPATIVMMIAGAYMAIFKLGIFHSFLLSLGPTIFFMVICLTTKDRTQVSVAMALSAFYSVIMMLVLVSTIITVVRGSILSPSFVFFAALVAITVFVALLHPQEMFCVCHGLLYLLCIPTGYLLLTIYSLSNMHVVSWGTRETVEKKSLEELEKEQKEKEERERIARERPRGLFAWLGLSSFMHDLKLYAESIIGFKPAARPIDEKILETLMQLKENDKNGQSATTKPNAPEPRPQNTNELREALKDKRAGKQPQAPPRTNKRKETDQFKFLKDKSLGKGALLTLEAEEERFWKELISLYLKPLDKDEQKQASDATALKELRNNVMIGFTMLNLLWITVVFTMQLTKEDIKNFAFISIPRTDGMKEEKMEPLSLAFLFLYGIILLLQLIASFVHRMLTFMAIIAKVRVRWESPEADEASEALEIAGHLTQLPDYGGVDVDGVETVPTDTAAPTSNHSNHIARRRYRKNDRVRGNEMVNRVDQRYENMVKEARAWAKMHRSHHEHSDRDFDTVRDYYRYLQRQHPQERDAPWNGGRGYSSRAELHMA